MSRGQEELEAWDRPQNENPNEVNEKTELVLKGEELKRNHFLRTGALISLVGGFFIATLADIYLLSNGQEKWVVDLFSKVIIPILAILLGASAFDKK